MIELIAVLSAVGLVALGFWIGHACTMAFLRDQGCNPDYFFEEWRRKGD